MKVNFKHSLFVKAVKEDTKIENSEIQKDTFSFSTKKLNMDKEDFLNIYKISGGLNQAADGILETVGKKGETMGDTSKNLLVSALLNSGKAAGITEKIFSPAGVTAILPENYLVSGAREISENIIAIDINEPAKEEDFFSQKDYMENKPSHRVYIGFDSDNERGFVYPLNMEMYPHMMKDE